MLGVLLLTLFAAELRCKSRDNHPPETERRCIVALVGKCFSYRLPPTIFVDSSIQVDTGILVHPILIDAKKRVSGGGEANTGSSYSLDRQVLTLMSIQRLVGAMSRASEVSIWGDCGRFGWVESVGVAPLSLFTGQVDLLDGKLQWVYLVRMCEEHPGGGNIFELCPDFLFTY